MVRLSAGCIAGKATADELARHLALKEELGKIHCLELDFYTSECSPRAFASERGEGRRVCFQT